MNEGLTSPKPQQLTSSWSNRILIAAVVGILFLTLYPFRFNFHPVGRGPSYLLNGWVKDAGPLDIFLNILLFAPFGFGLAERFRERGKSTWVVLGAAWGAGAVLSYTVEFLQFYIPMRDSGWGDIVTNSTGSLLGSLLFVLCGLGVVRLFSATERLLGSWLTLSHALLLLTIYFGLWLAFSIPLQKETQLSNWRPDSLLAVGNTASGQVAPAWKGQVFQIELWDHALSREFAEGITSGAPVGLTPYAAYDLSGSPPFQDQRHLLPDISWARKAPPGSPADTEFALNGQSWLDSQGPVSVLVTDVQATRQFALRVRCEPAETAGMSGTILSISQVSGTSDLELQQQGASLVFWFRNPISVKRSTLAWNVPNIFVANQPRDLLLTYDGANLSLYVDGRAARQNYRLGPATALAQFIRRVRPAELEGYRYAFYALIFVPAGILLEFARRKEARRRSPRRAVLVLAILVPSVLLELVFVHVSGRIVSPGNIALSVVLMVAGALWFCADGAAHLSIR